MRVESTAALERIAPRSQAGHYGKNGRPPFVPTLTQRHQVELLAGFGLRQEQVASAIINPGTGRPVSTRTLRAHFHHELSVGAARANAAVASNVFQIALGNGRSALRAAIFWLKCQAGWCDKCRCSTQVHRLENSRSGVVVAPHGTTPADWLARQERES